MRISPRRTHREGAIASRLDIRSASETEMRKPARREMVDDLPEPARRANPIRKVGVQIEDVLHAARAGGLQDATDKAIELLEQVRIRARASATMPIRSSSRAACASASSSRWRSRAGRSS